MHAVAARMFSGEVPKLDINSERAIRKGGESIIGEKGVKEGFAFAYGSVETENKTGTFW